MKGCEALDKATLINHLKSGIDINLLVKEVSEDLTLLDILFEIVLTETSSIKYACTKIIRIISEQKPEVIYPYFDDITKWIYHKNSFIKWDGIITISNLVSVDYEDQFKAIYHEYFKLIHDSQMITAANVIGNTWKIVIARPEWESDITGRLLEVPNIVYLHKKEPSPECNRIVCGQVIECFEHYFDISKNQAEMIKFAKGQLQNSRKKAAEKAERFLKRYEK